MAPPSSVTSARTAARASATSSSSPIWSSAPTTSRARSPAASATSDVHLIGIRRLLPERYADRDACERLCTHPNVGGVLLVSLGCESFDRAAAGAKRSQASGRPVELLVIQADRRNARDRSPPAAHGSSEALPKCRRAAACRWALPELVVGTICGGSDATSGLTANPAIGIAFDMLVDAGAAAIFEETGELIGCEHIMAGRAVTPNWAGRLFAASPRPRTITGAGPRQFRRRQRRGRPDDDEEKSLGAYAKSGSPPISGLLKPGDLPPRGRACICWMSSPTARSAWVSPISTTTPRSPN